MKNLIFVGSTFFFSDCSKVMRFLSMQPQNAKIGKFPLLSTLRFVKQIFILGFEIFVPNLFLLPFLSFHYICVSITYEQTAGFQEEDYDD